METREGKPEEEQEFEPSVAGDPGEEEGVGGALEEEGEEGGDEPVEGPVLEVVWVVGVIVVGLMTTGGRSGLGNVGLLLWVGVVGLVPEDGTARGDDGVDVKDANAVGVRVRWL